MEEKKSGLSKFEILFWFSEALAILLFGTSTTFATGMDTKTPQDYVTQQTIKESLWTVYPCFQDVHVMIFIGFGFLMTFLRTHSWTSVSFNFLISCWVLQWQILIGGFFHQLLAAKGWHTIEINLKSMVAADFGAGAVMISFGAILGKVNMPQLWLLACLEIIFYAFNEAILVTQLKISDIGGSMVIHTFGAYFGLAATIFFRGKEAKESRNNATSYNSSMFAMIGTIFLWMYWPSFNGALASGDFQQRCFVNTVLCLTASCLGACLTSRLMNDSRLDMEVVLNATLSGGVAIGSSADLAPHPIIPLVVGVLTGIISAVGFAKINGALLQKFNLHDTCGVHYLHGIPGIIGGLVGAFHCANIITIMGVTNADGFLKGLGGVNRDGQKQFGAQIGALLITLLISIVGGLITGFLVSRVPHVQTEQMFMDDHHFHGVEYPKEFSSQGHYQQVNTQFMSPEKSLPNQNVELTVQQEIHNLNKENEE